MDDFMPAACVAFVVFSWILAAWLIRKARTDPTIPRRSPDDAT